MKNNFFIELTIIINNMNYNRILLSDSSLEEEKIKTCELLLKEYFLSLTREQIFGAYELIINEYYTSDKFKCYEPELFLQYCEITLETILKTDTNKYVNVIQTIYNNHNVKILLGR